MLTHNFIHLQGNFTWATLLSHMKSSKPSFECLQTMLLHAKCSLLPCKNSVTRCLVASGF
jgi:hypothetical protein